MCNHFPKPLLASYLLTIAQRKKLHDQLRIKVRGEDIFHLLIGGAENSRINGLDAGQDEEFRPLAQSIHHKREVFIRKKEEKILEFKWSYCF